MTHTVSGRISRHCAEGSAALAVVSLTRPVSHACHQKSMPGFTELTVRKSTDGAGQKKSPGGKPGLGVGGGRSECGLGGLSEPVQGRAVPEARVCLGHLADGGPQPRQCAWPLDEVEACLPGDCVMYVVGLSARRVSGSVIQRQGLARWDLASQPCRYQKPRQRGGFVAG